MELFLIQQQRKNYEKKISSVKSFADESESSNLSTSMGRRIKLRNDSSRLFTYFHLVIFHLLIMQMTWC